MIARTLTTPALETFLDRSAAAPPFKDAVRTYAESRSPSERIRANAGAPPVKVLRVITKLLEEFPDEPIEAVEISASSGCSDFRGTLSVRGGNVGTIRFAWDCAWKARQVGYKGFLGFPDQHRAAAEFGHDCFEVFTRTD
jgi:hypothetical protein